MDDKLTGGCEGSLLFFSHFEFFPVRKVTLISLCFDSFGGELPFVPSRRQKVSKSSDFEGEVW
jgi:hypothetical protein